MKKKDYQMINRFEPVGYISYLCLSWSWIQALTNNYITGGQYPSSLAKTSRASSQLNRQIDIHKKHSKQN